MSGIAPVSPTPSPGVGKDNHAQTIRLLETRIANVEEKIESTKKDDKMSPEEKQKKLQSLAQEKAALEQQLARLRNSSKKETPKVEARDEASKNADEDIGGGRRARPSSQVDYFI